MTSGLEDIPGTAVCTICQDTSKMEMQGPWLKITKKFKTATSEHEKMALHV